MKLEQERPDGAEITRTDIEEKIGELRRAWTGNHSKAPGLERLKVLEGNLQAGIDPGAVMKQLDIIAGIFGDPELGGNGQENY
jgi:hypothetical protein